MAVVKAGVGALRMDTLGLNLNGDISGNPNNVRVTFSPDNYTDFGGSYTFGGPGQISGTTTSIVDTVNGQAHYSVTGIEADAQILFNLINQGNIIGAEAYVLRDNDRVLGGDLNDYLSGFAGDDTIKGGDGADILVGGAGRDRLTGGIGRDTFVFQDVADSTVDKSGRDTILDFSHGDRDKIDLSAIDAKAGTDRNDRFSLVEAFTGHAGELVVTEVRGGFLVQGDTDGIDGANFAITVKTDELQLVSTDFAF